MNEREDAWRRLQSVGQFIGSGAGGLADLNALLAGKVADAAGEAGRSLGESARAIGGGLAGVTNWNTPPTFATPGEQARDEALKRQKMESVALRGGPETPWPVNPAKPAVVPVPASNPAVAPTPTQTPAAAPAMQPAPAAAKPRVLTQTLGNPQVTNAVPTTQQGPSAVADAYGKADELRSKAYDTLTPTPEQLQEQTGLGNLNRNVGLRMAILGGEEMRAPGGMILKQAMEQQGKGQLDPLKASELKAKKLDVEAAAWDRRAQLAQTSDDRRFAVEQARMTREHSDRLAAQGRAEARADRMAMFGARQAAGGAGGKVTESEAASAGYLGRMRNAENIINTVGSAGRPSLLTSAMGYEGLSGLARPYVEGSAQQQYRQAQEDWVRAKLRKESGAVIGEDEMEREIRTYFPMPGENDQIITDQKAQARRQAETQLKSMANRAPDVAVESSRPSTPSRRLEDRKNAYLREP